MMVMVVAMVRSIWSGRAPLAVALGHRFALAAGNGAALMTALLLLLGVGLFAPPRASVVLVAVASFLLAMASSSAAAAVSSRALAASSSLMVLVPTLPPLSLLHLALCFFAFLRFHRRL